MTPEAIEYLSGLLPPSPEWSGMGALKLHPDPRDWSVTRFPGVPEILPSVPDSVPPFPTQAPYDQNGYGACVAASTSGGCSIDTLKNQGRWDVFDWHALYTQAGGTGQNGVDSRLVLQICQEQGTPLVSGGREKEIAAYAFVTQQPGTFRQEIKACIAAGYPVMLALLLPSDFGWQSGHGSVTQGYHQVCVVGYDATYAIILNSWGQAWGHNGIGSLAWDYLEANGLQHGYCFAYTTTSTAPNPNPPPPPPPPVGRKFSGSGTISGTGAGAVAVGSSLNVTGAGIVGNLSVSAIDGGDDHNNPPPPPPPPGDLKVIVATQRRGGVVWAQAQDSSGQYVTGTAQGTAGGMALEPRACSRVPAIWQKPGAQGAVSVTITTSDNRSGTGTASL